MRKYFELDALALTVALAVQTLAAALSESTSAHASKKIVLTTFGTLGDLHPYIALGLELKARGHRPIIATADFYKKKIEALGLGFAAVGGSLADPTSAEAQEMISKVIHPRTGARYLIRDLLVPAVREVYRDLKEVAAGADGFVTHPITFAGPLVAQQMKVPWVATVLAPVSLWSNYDPPVMPANLPWLRSVLRFAGPGVTGAFKKVVEGATRGWFKELDKFRAELGLPRGEHPLFSGQYSPLLNLGLFSSVLMEQQPDWPANTHVTGYCFYDKKDDRPTPPALQQFLQAGKPPIVFTLGSAAVHVAGTFFEESVKAVSALGERAVLLIGDGQLPPDRLPTEIKAFGYVPYGEIFPHAKMVVFQGGAGTTGQVLKAGVQSLVRTEVFDQTDNGARVERLGAGLAVRGKDYRADRIVPKMRQLLQNPQYARRAQEIGQRVRAENGPSAAVDLMLTALGE